jgi:hypothetical protein
VPERIRIAAPSLEVAKRLSAALPECTVGVVDRDGEWLVEVECDREFNELLLEVLDAAERFLATEPGPRLRLVVEGRSYRLHPPPGGDGAAALS